jgi:hypothetical protein
MQLAISLVYFLVKIIELSILNVCCTLLNICHCNILWFDYLIIQWQWKFYYNFGVCGGPNLHLHHIHITFIIFL